MLISCPECNNQISDKAISCPHCGFPMLQTITLSTNEQKPLKKPSTRSKRHRRKLPNGYGSVQKLSGRRTHPFAAYPAIKEFKENGSPVRQKALGYYATWYDAYDALAEYNKLSDQEKDEKAKKTLMMSFTFEEIYKMYWNDKFKKEIEAGKKVPMMYSMQSAFKNCSSIHASVYSRLRKDDFQKVIDECTLKHAGKELIITLFHQMAHFALANDYIEKDYSQFTKIDIEDDDEKGVPFTEEELKVLWEHSNDKIVGIILIMIYTGFRIAAFNTISINLDDWCFVGGVKTKKSKNRLVPVHTKIRPFVTQDTFVGFKANDFRNNYFYPKMEELGIAYTSDGKKHTPHDCRHTFSWLCDKYTVDDVSKHLLMGHTLKGDVENKVYAHRTLDELKEAIERIDNSNYLRKEIK